MEQYPIPQFIEHEGRIIYFVTFKQFFYIIGAAGVCFVLFFFLPFPIFIIVALLIMGGSVAFAFVKINGQTLPEIMFSSFGFLLGSKNYTWKKKESPYPFKTIKKAKIEKIEEEPVLKTRQGRLRKMQTSVELKTK